MKEKTCTKCCIKYPLTAEFFYRDRSRKDGLRSRCKKCVNELKRKEKIKGMCDYCGKKFEGTIRKVFCSKICYQKSYNRKIAKQQQKSHLLKTYGISKETFDEIFIYIQKRKCMICGKSLEKYHVDHDHKTGEFRGLLCGNCNRGLGCFKDNLFIVFRAVEYLKGERYRNI